MKRLQGKVAIVTGAGSQGEGIGNGKATAILFAREGAKVLLVDKNQKAAEVTLQMIQRENGNAIVCCEDLRQESSCEKMVKVCVNEYGRVDILINNIGIGSSIGGLLKTTEAEWEEVFSVNLMTMVFSSKAAIPIMKEQGGGAIINMSSYSGLRNTRMIAYGTSKAAVIHLTKTMAADYGAENIRVNCIAPGYLDTPMVSARVPMTAERRKSREEASPLRRQGTGWDVAWACVFLCSDEASFITGAVLPVDGGRMCK